MSQYKIEPINNQPNKKILTALDVVEQYTPQGTQTVLKVEDMDINELKLSQIRPWDLYIAAGLTLSRVRMDPEDAIDLADKILKARRERYPQDE